MEEKPNKKLSRENQFVPKGCQAHFALSTNIVFSAEDENEPHLITITLIQRRGSENRMKHLGSLQARRSGDVGRHPSAKQKAISSPDHMKGPANMQVICCSNLEKGEC